MVGEMALTEVTVATKIEAGGREDLEALEALEDRATLEDLEVRGEAVAPMAPTGATATIGSETFSRETRSASNR